MNTILGTSYSAIPFFTINADKSKRYRILYRGDEPLGIVPEEEFWKLENPNEHWSRLMTLDEADDLCVEWCLRPCGNSD